MNAVKEEYYLVIDSMLHTVILRKFYANVYPPNCPVMQHKWLRKMFHICQIRIFLLKSSKVIETFSVAGIIAEQVLQARQILQAEACSDPCSLHLAHITILCHIAYIVPLMLHITILCHIAYIFHLMMHIPILCHTASRKYHEMVM